MTETQHDADDNTTTHRSVEEAAELGALPVTPHDPSDEEISAARERSDDGVIPETDNDLDPDRAMDTEERERRIGADETVAGINQPGSHTG
jgi:hypothetical protein